MKVPKGAKNELKDLTVKEVSLVDRGANKQKFLIIKRDESGNTIETLENSEMIIEDTNSDFLDLLGLDDKTSVQEVTKTDNTTSDLEVVELEDVSDDTAVDTSDLSVQKSVKGVIQTLTEIVNKSKSENKFDEKSTEEIKKVSEDLIKLADQNGAKAETVQVEKSADSIKTVVKATEQFVKISNDIKKIDSSSEIPQDIVDSLKSAATLLASSVNTKVEKAEEQEVTTVPEVVSEEPKAEEQIKVFKTESEDSDPQLILKAGAKMKQMRLSEFKKAVESLQNILKQIDGSATLIVKAVDEPFDQKAFVDKIEKGLQKGFGQLDKKLTTQLEETNKSLESKIEAITKSVEVIGKTTPAGNGDADNEEIQKNEQEKPGLWSSMCFFD